MKRNIISISILVFLLIFSTNLISIAQEAEQKKQPSQEQINKYIEEWLKSPIKYIITKKEAKEYKKLTNREERIRYINYFWLRRDPNPQTQVNEYRDEFYKKVATANKHFSVGSKEGWKTHRGQIFIVFGPTQEIHRGVTTSLRSYEVWTYYRLESRKIPSQYSIVFIDWIGNRDYQIAYSDYLGKTAFERRMDLMHFIPRTSYIPMEIVSAMEEMREKAIVNPDIKFEDVPIAVKAVSNLPFKFYRAYLQTDESKIRSILGINLNYKDIVFGEEEGEQLSPAITVEAALLDKDKNPVDSFKDKVSFSIDAQELEKKIDDSFLYWRSLQAEPGEYLLSINVEDELSGASSVWEKEIELPELKNEELTFTEILLADAIAPTEKTESAQGDINTLLLMGYKIIPNVEGIYHPDSNLCFFLQFINLKLDEQSFKPLAEIKCAILKNRKAFKELKIPEVSLSSRKPDEILAHFCMSLNDFSPGKYSVEIIALDKIADKSVSKRVDFEVVEKSK
jgi:GWxTD domain-containing protein